MVSAAVVHLDIKPSSLPTIGTAASAELGAEKAISFGEKASNRCARGIETYRQRVMSSRQLETRPGILNIRENDGAKIAPRPHVFPLYILSR